MKIKPSLNKRVNVNSKVLFDPNKMNVNYGLIKFHLPKQIGVKVTIIKLPEHYLGCFLFSRHSVRRQIGPFLVLQKTQFEIQRWRRHLTEINFQRTQFVLSGFPFNVLRGLCALITCLSSWRWVHTSSSIIAIIVECY